MSYIRSYKSWIFTVKVFKCDKCGREIDESDARYYEGNIDYCVECAFKLGHISEDDFLRLHGECSFAYSAGINPITNEIEVKRRNSKFSWEKTNSDYRHSTEYVEWRKAVFERDKYTCQLCNQTGNKLEAHHVVPFKDFKEYRFIIENGVTLCSNCHKSFKKGDKWNDKKVQSRDRLLLT